MPRILLALIASLAFSGRAFALDSSDADLALAQAERAVQAAERDDAARYAPADLATARALLLAARDAYDDREWTDSVLDAERAQADGDLAAARSRQFRAEAATAEIERSVEALRTEMGELR